MSKYLCLTDDEIAAALIEAAEDVDDAYDIIRASAPKKVNPKADSQGPSPKVGPSIPKTSTKRYKKSLKC